MKRGLNRLWMTFCMMLLVVQSSIAQCAMCRGSVESTVSAGDTSVASNLNLGILYLFFTPYVLLGVIALVWYRTSKRNAKIKGAGQLAG